MEIQGAGGAYSLTGAKQVESALQKTNKQLEKLLQKFAAASRITSAADDAAGFGVGEQLTSQIRGFKQASQNIADASAALDIADGAGHEIADLIQRQRELAIKAGGDTLNDGDRQALNTEYQALGQEINRISEVTQYNQRQVVSGTGLSSGSAQVQVGANAGEALNLPAIDFASIGKNLQSTSIDTAANASSAVGAIDHALNSIDTQRSTLGATINKLASAGENLSAAMINSQAADSVVNDEDMATGLAELTRQQILQEGAIRTFNRYNEITQSHILGLLQ